MTLKEVFKKVLPFFGLLLSAVLLGLGFKVFKDYVNGKITYDPIKKKKDFTLGKESNQIILKTGILEETTVTLPVGILNIDVLEAGQNKGSKDYYVRVNHEKIDLSNLPIADDSNLDI